jgi:hypothetical protein
MACDGANRVWQHHFGKGIVASPATSASPAPSPHIPNCSIGSLQQLIANGGRLKPLHKLILMSATYRQQSGRSSSFPARSQRTTRTGKFTLLRRMNKQRMEAEVIRDSILTASGKLNPKLGGPGIKPRLRPISCPPASATNGRCFKKKAPSSGGAAFTSM